MSRNLSAAVTSISQLPTLNYRMLCEVDSLSTGMTRACTGNQFIMFAGNTYSPVGQLGGVEKIQEESDIFPRAVRLWFSAVNTASIQDVLNENMFNRPVRLYRTFLTDSFTIVSSAEQVFNGRVNACEMVLKDPNRGDFFEIEVESRLVRTPRSQYFNRETLWTVYAASGDTFFDYITQIPLSRANWGEIALEGVPPRNPGDRPRDRMPIPMPGPPHRR
jgi:hypothetical protein